MRTGAWRMRVGTVDSARPLGGGTAYLVEAGGRRLVAKFGPGCRDEAEGLRQLGAAPGGPPVPDVCSLEEADLLVTAAVDQAPRTAGHDEALGRGLALLHQTTFPHWGGGSSWVGACPVDPAARTDGPAFYGARLLDLSARCALEPVVRPVAARLEELLPPGGPVLVHGDLWWGNVLSGSDGRSWLIDPSVHGGHAEEDLAMLALFGAVPDRLLHAYGEVRPSAHRLGGAGGAVPARPAPRARRAVRGRLPGPGARPWRAVSPETSDVAVRPRRGISP